MLNRKFLDTCNILQLVKSFPVILAAAEATAAAMSEMRVTKTTTTTTTTTNNNNNIKKKKKNNKEILKCDPCASKRLLLPAVHSHELSSISAFHDLSIRITATMLISFICSKFDFRTNYLHVTYFPCFIPHTKMFVETKPLSVCLSVCLSVPTVNYQMTKSIISIHFLRLSVNPTI